MGQVITTQGGSNLTAENLAPLTTEGTAMTTFAPGSTHIVSLTNFKDANGVPQPIPAGVLPKFVATPSDTAVTFGVQNADGSQPVTFKPTYTGNVTFSGTLAYPNGDPVALTPFTCTIAVPENKTADIVVT